MIFGRLQDLIKKPVFTEKLLSKLQLLNEMDFSTYAAGRHELDEESFFFVNEYETKEAADCFWEAHQQYLDVHFIVAGTEKIAVDHIANQQVKEEYDAVKDAIILDGEVNSVLMMNPGDALICFPEDTHMTGILAKEKRKIRKIVFKVKI